MNRRPVNPLRFEEKTLIFESQVDVKEADTNIGTINGLVGGKKLHETLRFHGKTMVSCRFFLFFPLIKPIH